MTQWSAGLLPAPLNSNPGMKLLEQAVNDRPFTPQVKTLALGAQALDVTRLGALTLTGHGGGSTMTALTNGTEGWSLVLTFTDANTTIQPGAALKLAGAVNFV